MNITTRTSEWGLSEFPTGVPPILYVQIASTAVWPTPAFRQALLRATRDCDGRAQMRVVRSPFRVHGTAVRLLGDWTCSASMVLRALSEVFCDRSPHD